MQILTFLLNAFTVACATFTLDLVWAKYTLAVTERRAVRAGVLSAIIFLLGGYTVMAYVKNPLLVIAAAIGAFFGTYVGCRKSS